MKTVPTHLGDMLRLHRMVNEHALRKIALDIGIAPATLMRIEHGEMFDVATMLRLWTWMLRPLP